MWEEVSGWSRLPLSWTGPEEEVQPCECERRILAEGTTNLGLAVWLAQGVSEAGE